MACLLASVVLAAGGAAAQDRPVERTRLEAAFLRNFARYVSWPPRAFANERSPWQICVLGDSHFDDALEATFDGRSEQGRNFEVIRGPTPEQLANCQIVFVDLPQPGQRRAVLRDLKKRPVLTVGHAPDLLEDGGIIRLTAGERIEMSINLDQARAVGLTVPAKMLELAREVIDNGVARRWR